MKPLTTVLLSLLFWLGTVADVRAQDSTTDGWMLVFDLGGTDLSLEGVSGDRGGLVGARVGYGFTRTFTLYMGMYEADLNIAPFNQGAKTTLGHVDLGVRLHLANQQRRLVPYGDVAISSLITQHVCDAARGTTSSVSRNGVSLGGGLALYLSRKWALDVNTKWSTGAVGPDSAGAPAGGFDAETVRVVVGVSWWP